MLTPFWPVNANLVEFGHFRKKDLQTKFSFIKKSENDYYGEITKKYF